MTVWQFDAAVVDGARWVAVGGAAWLAVVVAAAALETLTSGRVRALAATGCPVAWRPLLLLVVGTVLAGCGTSAATARTATPPETAGAPGPVVTVPHALLPVPAPPLDRVVTAPAPEPPPAPTELVVGPGDSLWSLARDTLPARATDPEVHRGVLALHRANRDVLGPDPDLIHPGQRLRVPTEKEPWP